MKLKMAARFVPTFMANATGWQLAPLCVSGGAEESDRVARRQFTSRGWGNLWIPNVEAPPPRRLSLRAILGLFRAEGSGR